jgi:hypothetical protein
MVLSFSFGFSVLFAAKVEVESIVAANKLSPIAMLLT